MPKQENETKSRINISMPVPHPATHPAQNHLPTYYKLFYDVALGEKSGHVSK